MIIATTNSKGGVGKSTIATHLAGWIHNYGYRVTLLDCDAQKLASRWIEDAVPEIDCVASHDPEVISKVIPKLAEAYDVVVIDAPGGLGDIAGAIMAHAFAVLIPTGASFQDVRGLEWTTEQVHEIQKLRGGLPHAVIVPVQVNARRKSYRYLMDTAKELHFGITESRITTREIWKAADPKTQDPKLIWQRGKSKDIRTATAEMDALFSEIFPEICEEEPGRIMAQFGTKKKVKPVTQSDDYSEQRNIANS